MPANAASRPSDPKISADADADLSPTRSERALALLEELTSALEEERRLLRTRGVDALLELAERKRVLIDELEGLQPVLLARLARDDDEVAAGRLRDRLLACRESNSRNGAIARTAAGGARATLALLRAALAFDDLTLYDERGELSERREQRSLGRI